VDRPRHGRPDIFTTAKNLAGTTTPTDDSMTTTVNGDLIVSVCASDGSAVTAGAGYTLLGDTGIGPGWEYQVQSTAGAIAPTLQPSPRARSPPSSRSRSSPPALPQRLAPRRRSTTAPPSSARPPDKGAPSGQGLPGAQLREPTTAAPAPVTTGTAIKTLLQIATPSTEDIAIVAWGIDFDGTAAAAPIKVELIDTDVAATVTAHVASGLVKLNGPSDAASVMTLGTTAPASPRRRRAPRRDVAAAGLPAGPPNGGYEYEFPLGRSRGSRSPGSSGSASRPPPP
jgi:hypothetical protein